jgi:hypothetical protein
MSSSNKRDRPWSVAIHADSFVLADGVKSAKLGDPDTPQAGTWIPLEPGWIVRDGPDGIEVEYQGSARGRVHWYPES